MKSIRVSDGEKFLESVKRHSGEEWLIIEHLAELTGILAGPDGDVSRGIFCQACRFGFRHDFTPYPVVEARTSLANDFGDEVHRRDCSHWKAYLDHPQAFFYSKEDRRQERSNRSPKPADSDHQCERCTTRAATLFRCVGKRICVACLGEVIQLTGGYPGFKSLVTVEEDPVDAPPVRGRRKRTPGVGRCRTCRAVGGLISIRGVGYCRPCATTQVEKILAV